MEWIASGLLVRALMASAVLKRAPPPSPWLPLMKIGSSMTLMATD
jgi:hypothetical protein